MTLYQMHCRVCDSRLRGVLIDTGWTKLAQCEYCSSTLDLRCYASDLDKHISTQREATNDFYGKQFDAHDYSAKVELGAKIFDQFIPYCTRWSNCFIDVGTGEGLVLREAAKHFPKAKGIDITAGVYERIGSTVPWPSNCEFQFFDTFLMDTESISMINMWHVLEHIPQPYEFVCDVSRRLESGGLLTGQIPMLKEEYVFKEHFIFYTEKSLRTLFERIGFLPIFFARDENLHFLTFCARRP